MQGVSLEVLHERIRRVRHPEAERREAKCGQRAQRRRRSHAGEHHVSLRDVPAGLGAGVISVAAYGIVVRAQTHGPLALVSALRETSVISAALIAALLLKEPFARRRLLPSVAVAFGIVLIAL